MLIFVGLVSLTAASPLLAEGSWTSGPPMSTPRVLPATGAINGKLYVAGGSLEFDFRSAIATLEIYDPASGEWSLGPPMPTGRTYALGAVLDDQLYVIGGWSSIGQFLTTVERYDPATDSWSELAGLPDVDTDSFGCGAGIIQNTIYLACPTFEFPPGFFFYQSKVYDPAADEWAYLDHRSTMNRSFAAATIGDQLYMAGGRDENASSSTLAVWAPLTANLTAAAPMPTPRIFPTAGAINGRLYVAGGQQFGGPVVETLDVYDPGTDSWAALPDMPMPRAGAGAAVIDGKLLVVGGYTENVSNPAGVSSMDIYDPTDPDLDNDGVPNDVDQCPGTPSGAVVAPNTGCSISQLCPCEGPRDAGRPWKNHGKYVSCTARATNEFARLGLVDHSEASALVSDAARSRCGRGR
jgi:hypothetical protein